jgi:hypothetical protein
MLEWSSSADTEVPLETLSHLAASALLAYLYTGRVPESSLADPQLCLEILIAADMFVDLTARYELPDLKSSVTEPIVKGLDPSNIFYVLNVAGQFHALALEERYIPLTFSCIAYLAQNYGACFDLANQSDPTHFLRFYLGLGQNLSEANDLVSLIKLASCT